MLRFNINPPLVTHYQNILIISLSIQETQDIHDHLLIFCLERHIAMLCVMVLTNNK